MTRLNPQTTPRHQLRAEKAARNKEAALNAHPDEINWGHVGTLEHYASLLKRIIDSAFSEGEHAE